MSHESSSLVSGSKAFGGAIEFGRTHVVMPKGKHQATIVWLHGRGDNGAKYAPAAQTLQRGNPLNYFWSQVLETLPSPNIKWICPTAPIRSVSIFGGFPSTAWFDAGDLSKDSLEDDPDDVEGMDASAAHVAKLLSTEPTNIKLGVGGFSMGAATALYSATCSAHGRYGNGKPYSVTLSAVVGLSGWLPCSRSLKNKVERLDVRHAASLPILLCHGKGDDIVLYKHGERSAEVLTSNGFQNLTFKSYDRLIHNIIPEEMNDLCYWLKATLELEGE